MNYKMLEINKISEISGLPENVLTQIKDIVFSSASVDDAVMFGSRALGTWKKFSDIDISLKGKNVSHDDLVGIMLKLEELNIPYMVDLNRFVSLTNPALIDHINRVGISLNLGKADKIK